MSHLKKLSLVSANMSESVFYDLIGYVENQTTLEELDLRYSRVRVRVFSKLLEAMTKVRTLVTVHLAHNNLVEQKLT